MLDHLKAYLKNFDWLIFLPVFFLAIFGLVEIYSVALGQEMVDLLNFKKQILFILIGLACFFFFALSSFHSLKSVSRYLYVLAIIVLLAVLFFGQTIRGTKGWFSLGGFNMQPVEFVKIVLIIFLSDFFARLSTRVKTVRHLVVSAGFTLLLAGLIILQPDFGSALMLISIWFIMILLSGFKRKYFVFIFTTVAIICTLSWFLFFKEYQKERILTFFNPGDNSLEQGYNVSQAMIAVGSGGITGKGVGFGSQSQLKFLPEAHTDFIFAVISEELGFLGVSLIILFFAVFFFRALAILKKVRNDFEAYVIIGASGLIFVEMFINIGMNLGIMPVVGIALPFVSYGGSSVIASFILAGIIENIAISAKLNY
ncbi:MAG: rod shape-determining protein RodA [Candidatus Falkowbacteria bacterium]|nr:rod shape-determining protein RodA [Candidatus Falkowbacteria bacterium]